MTASIEGQSGGPSALNWFANVSNVTHEIFVSAPWLPDRSQQFDPDRYADALAQAGVQAVEFHCKDHNGVCYYPTSQGPGFSRDLVGALVESLHARGIRFFAYVSAGYDAFAMARNPDWRVVDRAGRPRILFPPLELACFRSSYSEYLLDQVRDLVEGYAIDGLWLDIVPLAWPGPHTDSHLDDPAAETDFFMVHDIPLPCACSSCRQQFMVECGRPIPLVPTPDDRRAIFAFGVKGVSRLLHEARDLLKRSRPGALFTYNGSGCPGDPIDIGDIISMEAHAPEYAIQSFTARWARGRGRPVEVLTPGGVDGWLTPQSKPSALLQLETAIAGANGGKAVIGRVVAPDGSWDQAQLDDLSSVYTRLKDLGEPHPDSGSYAEILIASTIRADTAPELWSPMVKGLEFWHTALMQGHFQYDIADLARDLSGYKLIVLPDQRAMSDQEVSAIRGFVSNGGSIIATGEASLYNEDGEPRGDFALGDVLGVRYLGRSGLPFSYISMVDAKLRAALSGRQIVLKREPLLIDPVNSETLAVVEEPGLGPIDPHVIAWGYPEPIYGRSQPAVVSRNGGQGSAIYIAAALDEGPKQIAGSQVVEFEAVWLRQLGAALVLRGLGQPVLLTNAPPGIEVVLSRHANGYTVDFVDHTIGWPARMAHDARQAMTAEIRLKLDRESLGPIARARFPFGGDPAVVRGRWLEVTVPSFAIHSRLHID